jgi:hypothetical protein
MLMHVTPDEVGKLQRVARAQGGSLTVNPDTGLPEANFFSDLNPLNPNSAISKTGVAPLLVGAALGPAGFGLTAAEAGLAYGGISALSSGDLGKGLMAGLGAYGGAGLAAGLSGMGASALANDPSSAFYANSMDRASDLASNMQGSAASGASFADKLGAGASYAASNPKDALAALGSGSLMKGAGILGAATAPILAAKMVKTTTQPPAQTPSLIRPYTYTARPTTPTNMVGTQYRPGEDTSERNWMTGNFTAQTPYKAPGPEYAAEGGVIKMADGGVADLYGNLQRYAYNPSLTQFDPAAGSVNYGKLPRYRFNPATGRFELLPASVTDSSTASDGSGMGGDTGGGGFSGSDTGTGSGGSTDSGSSNSGTGSPTGSTMGDIGYAISNQSISPMAAAIASAMMDAMSSTSVNSVNATNGMDVESDAATAAGASTAAGADGPAGAGSTGMGSDVGGEGASAGAATGGGAAGDSGATGGGGGGAAGDGGSGSSGSSGDGGSGSGSGGDGGGSGGDARGGFYHNGQFNYHPHMAYGGLAMLASGGLGSLGGYSDGGRLLRGPGDGVSDSIPAQIGNKQPARLADGEFVVPARIVSELGNGSTEAGARQLYKMMDRVQKARAKTTGKQKLAKNTNAAKYLPA